MGHVMRQVLGQLLFMEDVFVSPRGEVMSA